MPIVRPTIRCLWDDLAADLQGGGLLESEIRDGRTARKLPHPSFRLDLLVHPVMNDARANYNEEMLRHLQAGSDIPLNRKFSLGQSTSGASWGMTWYKARSNDHVHLRGLVCLIQETFWLGWEADRNEDYASFNARKDADQSTSYFQPTRDDFDRLALEDAWTAVIQDRVDLSAWVIQAVIDAWQTKSTVQSTSPGGVASITAEVSPDSDDACEIDLQVTIHDASAVDRVFASVAQDFPGLELLDWEVHFPQGQMGFVAYALESNRFLDQLSSIGTQQGAAFLAANPALMADPEDGMSHFVMAPDVGRGYVDRVLIKGICGYRFVPSADPEECEVCPKCAIMGTVLDSR